MELSLFATVPAGLESLLAGELRLLGASEVKQARAGVSFTGSLETAYSVCLWSRLATRVLLPVRTGPARDGDELYLTTRGVDWGRHLSVDGTLAVDFTGQNDGIRDTRFGAVRVKDGIVDQFRERAGRRPSVDPRTPDLRVNAHLARSRVTLSLDLGGESLHRRGYRTDKAQVEAPLKENLAAGVLLFAAWATTAAEGGSFADPLCGSATLPIEAAWIAADVAPGLLRVEQAMQRGEAAFGFERWLGHDAAAWRELLREARERREAGLGRLAAQPGLAFLAADRDPRAVAVAEGCVARAGLGTLVAVRRADLADLEPPADAGLLATNAPYGERLANQGDAVYRLLGERVRAAFGAWGVAVLAGNERQIDLAGLTPTRSTALMNGPLSCTLAYAAPLRGRRDGPATHRPRSAAARGSSSPGVAAARAEDHASAVSGLEQFANRLRKNLRHVGRTMRRQGVTCYRLYDADLPEYNLALDVYEERLHVQEYAPPPDVPPAMAAARLTDALDVIASVLAVDRREIVVKQRRRQRGTAQYERRAQGGAFFPVTEEGLTYLVNLTDYLDTGLFLDQRLTRRLIRQTSGGRRFLNLFGYTGAATVSAVAGGASSSATVDLSVTYLDWARRNLRANGIEEGSAHRLLQADVLEWAVREEGQYDLILLDPPTFSNSKRMGRASFDVQRDHADLIRVVVRRLLAPGGVLIFCSNRRNFRLEGEALPGLALNDLSRATLPPDFARRAAFHHVWRIHVPSS